MQYSTYASCTVTNPLPLCKVVCSFCIVVVSLEDLDFLVVKGLNSVLSSTERLVFVLTCDLGTFG